MPDNGFQRQPGETHHDVRRQREDFAPVENCGRERLDRIDARILRLLHLCDGCISRLSAGLLPLAEPDGRHRRFAGDLRRWLRRPADRCVRAGSLWRYAWAEKRSGAVPVFDGLLDRARRSASDLSAYWNMGAGASCRVAADAGFRGRWRNFWRKLDGARACTFWATGIFCKL